MVAVAVAPFGATTRVGRVGECGPEHGSFGPPGGAQVDRRRRTEHVDLLDHELGPDAGDGGSDPRRASDADDAGPVGTHTRGDRRTLRAAAHDVLAAVEHTHRTSVSIGQPLGDGCDLAGDLAAERAAVRQRRHRFATGRTPRGVGLEVAGLDPGGLQRAIPFAGRRIDRPGEGGGRAPALDLAGELPRLASACRRRATRHLRRARRPAHQQVRCRRRSQLGHVRHPGRPLAGEPPSSDAASPKCPSDLSPWREIRRTERCRRSCASRCSGRGARRGRGGRRRPTCDPPARRRAR